MTDPLVPVINYLVCWWTRTFNCNTIPTHLKPCSQTPLNSGRVKWIPVGGSPQPSSSSPLKPTTPRPAVICGCLAWFCEVSSISFAVASQPLQTQFCCLRLAPVNSTLTPLGLLRWNQLFMGSRILGMRKPKQDRTSAQSPCSFQHSSWSPSSAL